MAGSAADCALRSAALAALLSAPSLAAETLHVENRCPRLSAAAYEELDARVLLLLRAEARERPPPAVVCTETAAWIEWEGERMAVSPRPPLQDEFLDAIEARLHQELRKEEADPATTEAVAVARGEPMLAADSTPPPSAAASSQRADPLATRASEARGGGIALGVQLEPSSDSIGVAVGPAFDFGGSVGPLLLQGREALRFAGTQRGRVMFMTFEGGVAFGAPLNPNARFGVVAFGGAEWLIAYPEGTSGQAAVVPIVALGLRAARLGLPNLWLGVDGHFRLRTLSLGSASPKAANDVGVITTLGFAFVDWSRK